jgi:hypothetical protein
MELDDHFFPLLGSDGSAIVDFSSPKVADDLETVDFAVIQ